MMNGQADGLSIQGGACPVLNEQREGSFNFQEGKFLYPYEKIEIPLI